MVLLDSLLLTTLEWLKVNWITYGWSEENSELTLQNSPEIVSETIQLRKT